MLGIFVYTIAAFGLAYVVGFSKVTLWIRNLIAPPKKTETVWSKRLQRRVPQNMALYYLRLMVVELMECPACLGFWIGVVASTLHTWAFLSPGLAALVIGFYTCGANFVLGRVTRLIG